MKKFILILFAITMTTAFLPIQKKFRVIFFGDSITEAGVAPTGFITRIGEILKQKGVNSQYDLIGAGISGNKVYDLYFRLEEDVLAKKPDIVVIWVGVNDVWHKRSFGTGTDEDKFEKFYTAMIKKIKASGSRIIICTPAVIGEKTDFSNELDGDLNQYANIVRAIARNTNAPLVDLRKAFLEYNLIHNKENKPSGILTQDRVHLNPEGNKLVAEEISKVLLNL